MRATEPDGQPRHEMVHASRVGETDLVERVASPMQPNRHGFEDTDEYERAVTCARCDGEAL